LSPETCRAELKRLINEKVVTPCWLLTSVSSFKLWPGPPGLFEFIKD